MRFLHEEFRPTTSALHRLVAHAYQNNASFRGKMDEHGVAAHEIKELDDLHRLPLMTREVLAEDPWSLLCVPRASLVQAHMSTGTTGKKSVYVAYDWEDLYERGLMPLLAEAPSTKLLKIEPGEIVFNALPYEVSVTGLAVHRSVQDGLGACVVPVGKGGFYSDPRKTLKIMKEIQGDHLFTTPSYAIYLGELATEMGELPRDLANLKSVWLVGELCSNALRHRIQQLWGCPAYLYYGSMESGPIGLECAEQDGLHVASNFSAVELVPSAMDPKSEADTSNDGTELRELAREVVVTTLWRYATPVIRYRTGDLARWEMSPCKCGLASRRLRLMGRIEDVLEIAGKQLHVLEIEQGLLAIQGVSSWFQIDACDDVLRIHLPANEDADRAEVEARVKGWVRHALDISCSVVPAAPSQYAGGKFMRVIRAHKEV